MTLADDTRGALAKKANAITRSSDVTKGTSGPNGRRSAAEGSIKGMARDIARRSLSGSTKMTPRERRVLAAIVVGHSSKEVARALDISPRTVEFHRANLLRKFHAKNTADLVHKASHTHKS